MAVLTTDDLIRSIKRKAMLPENDNTFSEPDYIEMLNEEIANNLLQMLLDVQEEHLVVSQDFDLETSEINEIAPYQIPSRAVANKLRAIKIVDNANNIFDLSRISFEELADYSNNFNSSYVFYVENSNVIFPGRFPISNGVVRMFYYLSPSTLVPNNRAGVISGIDTVTGVITLSNFPSDFTDTTQIDLVQSKAPNKIQGWDIDVVSIDSTLKTITIAPADMPDNLVVGDYVNLPEETIVPQLPSEMHPLLAQSVAVSALESLGDTEGYNVAMSRYEKMEKNITRMLDDRVEGSPRKIKPRYSPLNETGNNYGRRGRYRYWR